MAEDELPVVQQSRTPMHDVWEAHPAMGALLVELPWKDGGRDTNDPRSGGLRPQWYEARRDQWMLALCAMVDLVFECLPDPAGGRAVTPLMAAATGGVQSAVSDELAAELRLENERLTGELAEAFEQRDAALASAESAHESESARMRYAGEVTAEVKRQAEEVTKLSAMLDTEHENVKRAVAERDELRAQLDQLRQAAGAHAEPVTQVDVSRMTVESRSLPGLQLPGVACKVDDCDGIGPKRGMWAGICPDDRELLESGGRVLIGGVEHYLWQNPQVPNSRSVRRVE